MDFLDAESSGVVLASDWSGYLSSSFSSGPRNCNCSALLSELLHNATAPGHQLGATMLGVSWFDNVLRDDLVGIIAKVANFAGLALAALSLFRQVLPRLALPASRSLLAAILGMCREEGAPTALQEKLLDFKVGELRWLLHTACYVLVPFTLWSPRVAYIPQGSLSLSILQIALSLLSLFPWAVGPKTFDAVFCALVLLISATPVTCTVETIVPTILLADGLMLALVAVRRRMRTRLPVYAVMGSLFALGTLSTICLRLPQILGQRIVETAVAQGALLVLMLMATPVLERRSRANVEQLLQVEELQELLAASQCLLRSCFDVVVELDAEGCIVSTGPELGSLLLRESTRQCMQGTDFMELIENTELREEFAGRLAGATMQGLGLGEHAHLPQGRRRQRPAPGSDVVWLCMHGEGQPREALHAGLEGVL